LNRITISQESWFLFFWTPFETIVFLISSYFYAWLVAFGTRGLPESGHNLMICFEITFAFSIIVTSLTQYTPDGDTIPVKDAGLTLKRYVQGPYFYLDLISIAPIVELVTFKNKSLLYFFKVLRYYKGMKFYDV
jgi:hypothetical protein